MYMCMWGYLDKYIRVATWPPQTKILGSAPAYARVYIYRKIIVYSRSIINSYFLFSHE